MVSDVTSVRLWSQQAALKAFKDASDSTTSSDSSSASASNQTLADIMFSDGSSDGDDDTTLTNLIASLQKQAMTGIADTDQQSDGSVDDISSKAYMNALRDKLEELKASPATSAMADKMLAALDDGTLTVSNVVSGEQITAWDTSDSKATAQTGTSTDKTDWSTFLKQNLVRDDSGRYIRNDDQSYQEKTTGNGSYFGMVAGTYYYLSWPAQMTTMDTKAAASTSAE